ncbi:hypothetical protein F443_14307 [Phytophthora nicotianae P1569]|uniref:HTH CENPB-type domain-containing protein n=1 Tax=Phytophthora nicotianae P1569 TaxID=1317065 RepID=V9ELX7_PHYNI|nr:hypothetical protein F443_14307 [Phytophthora nicotianae P1569]
MRKEGCQVSAKMLELKTLELAADAGISSESFSASYSWRRRFMRRHRLSVRARTRQGQTTPEDAVAARTKFRGEVRAAIVEHNIIQVFNADQTAVFFEYLPRKTITTRGEKTVWVKCSGKDKEQATTMLLADWHGNKRAPFLVLKAGVSQIAPLQAKHHCQIYGNPTAWWNTDISVKFLDYHFATKTTCMRRSSFCGMTSRDIGPKRSLTHRRGLESAIQVALAKAMDRVSSWSDLGPLCKRKGVAKDKVIQLQEKLSRMAFEMVAPKRHEITAWIAESWSELSVDTIVSGFAKTELLTDTHNPVVAKDHDKPLDISDVLNQLADLGVADETVGSGDELVSSDSSDNE